MAAHVPGMSTPDRFLAAPLLMPWRYAVLVLLCLLAALGQAAPAPKGAAEVDEQALQRRIAAVQARTDLDAAARSRSVELYQQAIAEIQATRELQEVSQGLIKDMRDAPQTLRDLERQIRTMENRGPPAASAQQDAPPEQLERMELEQRTKEEGARQALVELERHVDALNAGPQELRRQQEELRAALDRAEPPPEQARNGKPDAQQVLERARDGTRQRQLEKLNLELAYQPFLLRVTQLRRDLARAEWQRAQDALQALRKQLEQRRQADADAARQAAREPQPHEALPPFLAQMESANIRLRSDIAETAVAIDGASAEISARRAALADVETEIRLAQRRAQAPASPNVGAALIRSLDGLPGAERYAQARGRREALLAQTSDANVAIERESAALADPASAVNRGMAALGSLEGEARATAESTLRRLLTEQRSLLARLDDLQDELVRTLREEEEAELELLARSAQARERLQSSLFWVPFSPLQAQTFVDLQGAISWLFSAENWRALAAVLPGALRHDPIIAVLPLLTLALLAGRRRLKQRLAGLTPAARLLFGFRIQHTLEALGITLLLALPWGLLAWGMGRLLTEAPAAGGFTRAVGAGLSVSGVILLLGQGFVWLLDRRGVAVNHFGWVADKVARTQKELRGLLVAYVPLAFVAVAASASQDDALRNSLGRLALMLVLGMVSLFWARNMRPGEHYILSDKVLGRGVLPLPLARLAYWGGIALPLGLAALAAMGYFFAAVSLYRLLLKTLLLGLGGVMLYGLVALWTLVQKARLELRRDDVPVITDSAEGAIVCRQALDLATIGGQTRQMLNMLVTLVFAVGLYLIWLGAVPGLQVVSDFELWRYTETVDGEKVSRTLTLGGVFLALAVVTVTLIATRNVGGMLDAMLLKRLEFRPDANYAIKTVSRYLIAVVGILIATNLFGISWSRAQWLVAALGVGLGFGLQEIVANFISGLIVLAERPIRIGDTITVADVTGTVSRIRARATVVTDFDNKEVLIPNKAFITERVVNWTLSSQVTRVLIKLGVAYGTDPQRAQAVILAAVNSAPLVLRDPPASVFFKNFGDSALEFEIRAFADGMDKRLPLTHQVNTAIAKALAEAGIEIPFPQRDLHIRSGAAPG